MGWRRWGAVLLALVGMVALYLLFWPVAIEPQAWKPPEAPALTGVYEPNTLLAPVERLGRGVGIGAEDVAIDRSGRIYGGFEDGRVVRLQPDGSRPEMFAETGGRPLGMQFDRSGNLVVCDSPRGLISIAPDGIVTVLSTEEGGVPYRLADDVDIASDGTVYFSDASSRFDFTQSTADLMEHRPNGRLLAYDPEAGTSRLVVDRLYFANGVAVSPDQSFVLVVETGKYRVHRHWLSGPRQGQTEIFIDNLPGFPDGISSNGKGIFWLPLVSPRKPNVDWLLERPFLRKLILRLPKAMILAPENYGFVLGLDGSGRVVHNLQDPAASFAQISSVEEHDGKLFLGSLVEDAIGRIPVPGS
jgi:sugar lactone lactonase YvrE